MAKFLPKHVRPSHYRLELSYDLQKNEFYGRLWITLEVKKPVRELLLHQYMLDVTPGCVLRVVAEGEAEEGGGAEAEQQKSWTVSGVLEDNEAQTVTLKLGQEVGPLKKAELALEYKGKLRKEMEGLYLTSYKLPDGSSAPTITTQFEPTEARRMMPCFDEPSMKATFQVSVLAQERLTVLSNMPPVTEDNVMPNVHPPMRRWDFQTTPIMSTYLLALSVGEWDKVQVTSANGTLIRVHTPLGRAEEGRFAAGFCKQVLEFFEQYFDIKYPLPKLDVISVENFNAGAMENWGLIVCASSCLLVDKGTAGSSKRFIMEVLAHEIAHMWFGNLVTPRFWDNLWLKEGFATFMAVFVNDRLDPSMAWFEYLMSSQTDMGKKLDSVVNTHPLESPVTNPGEISNMFDHISYYKGATLVRQVVDYVGEKAFQQGIREYLNKFAYKNASTADLWSALGNASGKKVRSVMGTWVKQEGLPLITVAKGKAKDSVVFKQERFMADGSSAEAAKEWIVPIHVSLAGKTRLLVELAEKEAELVIAGLDDAAYAVFNAGGSGFFRVSYSEELRQKLLSHLSDVSSADQLLLVQDAAALCKAGKMGVGEVLELMQSLKESDSPYVWESIIGVFSGYRKLWGKDKSLGELLAAYGRNLFTSIWKKIGPDPKEGDSPNIGALRTSLYTQLASCNDPAVLAHAKSVFDAADVLKTPGPIRSPVWRTAVYCEVEGAKEALQKLASTTDNADDRIDAIRAITSVKTAAEATELLDAWLADPQWPEGIRYYMAYIQRSTAVYSVATQWYIAHFDAIAKILGYNTMLGGCIASGSVSAEEADANAVEEFLKGLTDEKVRSYVEKNAKQTIESIRINAAFKKAQATSLRKFLKQSSQL